MNHIFCLLLPFYFCPLDGSNTLTFPRRGALSFDIPSLSINLADAFELFESSKQARFCFFFMRMPVAWISNLEPQAAARLLRANSPIHRIFTSSTTASARPHWSRCFCPSQTSRKTRTLALLWAMLRGPLFPLATVQMVLPLPLATALPLPLATALPLPLATALPLPLATALPLPLATVLLQARMLFPEFKNACPFAQ
jgi:hypothetical protein